MMWENATKLPNGDAWYYEPNWAGERLLGVKEGTNTRLLSLASSKDMTNRFPTLAALVARLPAEKLMIEGVARSVEPWQQDAFVASESVSAPPFGAAPIRLIATDILWVDGLDLRQLALSDRKHRLRQLIARTSMLEPLPLAVPHNELLQHARRLGAEGVIAKRRNSRYRPFARASDWIRVPIHSLASSPAADRSDQRQPFQLAL